VKRILGLAIFILLAATAFPEGNPYGGSIVIADYDQPTTLNALYTPEGYAALIENFFTDGLITFSESGQPIPELAESWDVSPDGLTWTFHIRKGVLFSDGTELTADDVQFTYDKGNDPRYGSRYASFAQVVKNFMPDGKYSFKIILKNAYGALPVLLGRPIVPKHLLRDQAAEEYYAKHPIGTGPFTLTEWTPGQLIFDANPNYFLGRPHLDRITFKVFPDNKSAWVSMMQGHADFVPEVDYDDYRVIKGDPRFAAYEHLDDFCYSLFFNNKDPLFSDPRIRQAISVAIDRKDLTDTVLQSEGVAANGPFKPGTWAYSPDANGQSYDPAAAKKILTDLGWKDSSKGWVLTKNGQELRFKTAIYSGSSIEELTAKRLQWQLLLVGIRMDIDEMPVPDLLKKMSQPGSFQSMLVQFNTYQDPDTSAGLLWYSRSNTAGNFTSYSNPAVDRLIDLGRSTSDFSARKGIYQQMHGLIAQDAPAAFLYFSNSFTATSSRLHGPTSRGVAQIVGYVQNWYVTSETSTGRR